MPKAFKKTHANAIVSFVAGVGRALAGYAARLEFPKDLSLEDWGRRFCPLYFPLPCGKHHKQIDDILRGLGKRKRFVDGKLRTGGRKVVIKAPRGNSKSTFCTFLYPLHEICEYLTGVGKGEAYILLIADTYKQAKKYLAAIKHELEHNEELAKIYPHACGAGSVWSEDEILTRNGVRVEILGSGQKIRGRKEKNLRPTLIIVDDPEGDECAYSVTIRDHTREWFLKGVMHAGGPHTNILLVGTNVHEECLVATVSQGEHAVGWEQWNFQSILRWPNRLDLWDEWEMVLRDTSRPDPEGRAQQFKNEHWKDMHEGAEVLWEEHEDLDALMLLRAGGHNSFEAEKQNDPVDASKVEWPSKEFFPASCWVDEMPPPEACQVRASYCDPSKGKEDKHGDFQALVDAAVGKDGLIYIDSDIGYWTLPNMCCEFVKRANRNKSWVAKCESNAMQELLLPDLEAAANELGILCPIQGQENMTNKDLRIRRFCGPYITRGRVKFVRRSRGNAEMIKQLSRFPTAGKKDGPDALAGVIQCCEELLNNESEQAPEEP